MDFRFDDEQIALRDSIRALADAHFDFAMVAGREGMPAEPATWRALADMGVFGLLVPSERDGFGGGAIYAVVVFEQLGAHLAAGPLLWSTIAAPLLPDVGSAAIRVTGVDLTSAPRAPFVIAHAAESAIVVALHDHGVAAFPTSALPEPMEGAPLDPLTPTLAFLEIPSGDAIGGPEEARRLRLVGTLLAAAQLVGGAQGALDVAVAYALARQQFGVAIGAFQAVKHLLADMYVRVEQARSALYAAAAVFDDTRAGDATTAVSTAKLLAGEAGIANARTAVQVLGGMGFTWQMAPHYFLKRAWVLEESFGTADAHALALSAALETEARAAVTTWT